MIPNQWYPILESRQLRGKKPLGVTRLGEQLVLWREANGRIVCMPDRCPHRSAMLSRGKIRDGCIECPYHGLRFNAAGRCTMIPANGCDAPVPNGFEIATRPVREEHGVIWYWFGAKQPAAQLPWPSEIAELGGNTVSFHYDTTVPQLRIVENVFDFHHFNFVHRWSIPGIGPRVDEYKAEQNGDTIEFGGTLRHEKPGLRKQDAKFKVKFRFPGVCAIKFGGIDIGYGFTPIDEHSSWIWTRYTHNKLPTYLGGAILSRVFAMLDYLIFHFQDIHVLRSQLDPVGDISKFHLYEADRAIGLFFGMVKRAMLEAEPRQHIEGQEDRERENQKRGAEEIATSIAG
jgi:phenylpropionate dioxygenase-like ring-hydroxylating dioxygenase large terminal subunit